MGSRADGNRRGPRPGRARRAVLLRKLADQAGLTAVLGSALTRAGKFPRIDVLHRQHAVVEDGVRAGKSMGLRNPHRKPGW